MSAAGRSPGRSLGMRPGLAEARRDNDAIKSMERKMTIVNEAQVEMQSELDLAAAKKALKDLTPEKLLEMNRAAQELKKQLEMRDAQRKEMEKAPVVDMAAFLTTLDQALQFFFPGKEFIYERGYLSQGLANSATFLGRNKLIRKRNAERRFRKADDADLHGVLEEPDLLGNSLGQATGIEIPQVERQRSADNLSVINESLTRTKALQRVAAYLFEHLSGQKWETPPTLEERRSQFRQRPQAEPEDDFRF